MPCSSVYTAGMVSDCTECDADGRGDRVPAEERVPAVRGGRDQLPARARHHQGGGATARDVGEDNCGGIASGEVHFIQKLRKGSGIVWGEDTRSHFSLLRKVSKLHN